MINQQQSMQCPNTNCKGQIKFETQLLLQGAKFSCPICKAALSIANESKEIVSQTMEKFDALKTKALSEQKG